MTTFKELASRKEVLEQKIQEMNEKLSPLTVANVLEVLLEQGNLEDLEKSLVKKEWFTEE